MASRRRKKRNEPIEIDGPEFRCHFLEMNQYPSLRMNDPESDIGKKPVRYHGSNFWNIDGFGVSRWVLGGYIVVDWQGLMEEGHSIEEIFKGCAKFLNKPPERRRFQKRITRPLFGNLDPTAVKVTPRVKEGQDVLEVLAITDKKRLRSAWGEGQTIPTKVKRKLV